MSKRQACALFSIRESSYYYRAIPKDDGPVRERLAELAELHSRWGFWMMHHHLRAMNHKWNHKKVYRVYTEMGLNLRRKYKKRLPSRIEEPLVQPLMPNLTWSMDFMHDALANGVKFRSFNVIDDYNREALNITLDTSLSSKRVIRELDKLIAWRGAPEQLRVDNGPEFIARPMEEWAEARGITVRFIQKGKPFQNGYVERFNKTFREEVLDRFSFTRLKEGQAFTDAWMWIYNNERPHKSLGYRSPVDFGQERLRRYASPTFLPDQELEWRTLISNTTI